MLKSGIRSEAEEQTALFEWAQYVPELRYMFAVPNGGKRNPREAKNLKLQGVKAGVPDICLPLPKGGYHGLYIEMKVGNNKPSEKQREYINYLASVGYAVDVCWDFEDAKACIEHYISLKD